MNTKELIEQLQRIDPTGDKQVAVPMSGCLAGSRAMVISANKSPTKWNDEILLGIDHPLISHELYLIREDEINNFKKIVFLWEKTSEGPLRCLGSNIVLGKSTKLQDGQEVRIRKCGDNKQETKVRILNKDEMSVYQFPTYIAEIIECKS